MAPRSKRATAKAVPEPAAAVDAAVAVADGNEAPPPPAPPSSSSPPPVVPKQEEEEKEENDADNNKPPADDPTPPPAQKKTTARKRKQQAATSSPTEDDAANENNNNSNKKANAPSEKKAKKSTATAKTTAAASKKKAPKQDPDEVVFRFVEERNKPVNAQLVADFLQTSKIAKTQVVKSLDALVDAGRIQCRVFGKSKLFWPHQDNPEDELTPEELAEFRAKLQEDAKRLAETNKLLAAERDTLKRLQASPSTAAARLLLERLRDDNARRSRALAASNNADGMPSLSDEDKKVLFNEHKRCTSAWKMHKMAYLELVGTLMDLNVPLTGEDGGPPNDEFWEEAGVINDEMDAKRRVAMMTARNSSTSSATADLEGAIFTLKTACDVIKRVKYQQRR